MFVTGIKKNGEFVPVQSIRSYKESEGVTSFIRNICTG